MHARPDGYAMAGQAVGWLVEAKTARYLDEEHGWGAEGTDQVPRHYLVQCVWQMACCDVDRCDLVAFGVASDDFRIYTIRRDFGVEKAVVNRARAWYQRHVEQGEPPGFDGSRAASEALARQHRQARKGATVEATADDLEAVAELRRVRDREQQLATKRRTLEQRLQARIGDAHRLTHDGETLATWSQPSERRRVDWQRLRREHPGLIDSYETDDTTITRSFRLRRERGPHDH
jgi:predicted phage-related endonuclease